MTSHKIHKTTISSKILLSKKGSVKKTYHIALNNPENIFFTPGDCIAIFPKNDREKVSSLTAAALNANSPLFYKRSGKTYFLKDFLSKAVNISKITSPLLKFLEKDCPALSFFLKDPQRLASFIKNHELLDVVQKYITKKISFQNISDFLLPLIPRFYSIASSYNYTKEIHITVTLLQYEIAGIKKYGTATNYLCNTDPEEIEFYIQPTHHFLLPKPSIPIIMIGAGTGIAPFRSFLQERYLQSAKNNWLFFGECNKNYDFYYEDFLTKLTRENFLKLDLAFSRDQEKKIYVQHKMLEKAEELWDWIENKKAYIYLCGSAKKMAKDVDQALLEIFQKKFSYPKALEYKIQLIKEKRYLKDIY